MTMTGELVSNGLVAGLGVAVAELPRVARTADDGREAEAQPPTAEAPLRVQMAIFDGFEVTDALAPYDALSIAAKVGAPIVVSLVTVNGEQEVTALDDVRVKPTAAFIPKRMYCSFPVRRRCGARDHDQPAWPKRWPPFASPASCSGPSAQAQSMRRVRAS